MAIWYLDTSAVAKLVRTEPETPALRRWLRGKRWILLDLHRTELRRAPPHRRGVRPRRRTCAHELRSLDALHVAAA